MANDKPKLRERANQWAAANSVESTRDITVEFTKPSSQDTVEFFAPAGVVIPEVSTVELGAREYYAKSHASVWKVYQWWNHPEEFEFAEAYAKETAKLKVEEATRELRRMFCDLTPGGSEFVDDPKRCAEFIADRLSTVVEQVKARRKAEQQLAERDSMLDKYADTERKLRKEVGELREALKSAQDIIAKCSNPTCKHERVPGKSKCFRCLLSAAKYSAKKRTRQ